MKNLSMNSCLLAALLAVTGQASASVVTWFGPSGASNSNANWPSGTAYTNNFGVVFETGPSGGYTMDWATIGLSSSSQSGGTASFTLAHRN